MPVVLHPGIRYPELTEPHRLDRAGSRADIRRNARIRQNEAHAVRLETQIHLSPPEKKRRLPKKPEASILPSENFLPADYLASAIARAVSIIRQEKPHSLSYQEPTFTKFDLPSITLVNVASNVEDSCVWL